MDTKSLKLIPFNTETDGTSRTVKAQYYKNGFVNFFIGGDYGATGVMCVTEEGSRGSIRLLCDDVFDNVVGSINSSQDGVIVHSDGFAPCLTSGHGNCPKIIEIYEIEDTASDQQGIC